jgi:hypothetical protein
MSNNLTIFLLLVTLIFLVVVYNYVVKRKLLLKYALLWIMFSIMLLISITFPIILVKVSDFIGVEVTSNMVFLVGFLVLLFINFMLTSIVSYQKAGIVNLAQEVSILKKRVDACEK